jgi:hypothetical protein
VEDREAIEIAREPGQRHLDLVELDPLCLEKPPSKP